MVDHSIEPGPSRPINELIEHLCRVADTPVDVMNTNDKFAVVNALNQHPMLRALQAVLVEQKEKTVLSVRNVPEENEETSQLLRLDNMLAAEGITGPEKLVLNSESAGENTADYQAKIVEYREFYAREMHKYEVENASFTKQVAKLIELQASMRPISQLEKERVLGGVQRRLCRIQVQFKQMLCESVMMLRNRFCDARRKRRNFSKQATEVLNEYFFANLANPYPSEEVKEELARKCNISVSQVSNWFGNKRIRYKKNMVKAQEEASMYAKRAQAVANNPFQPPATAASMPMAGYPMLGAAPGMVAYPFAADPLQGAFDLSSYNAQLFAHYQNAATGGTSTDQHGQ